MCAVDEMGKYSVNPSIIATIIASKVFISFLLYQDYTKWQKFQYQNRAKSERVQVLFFAMSKYLRSNNLDQVHHRVWYWHRVRSSTKSRAESPLYLRSLSGSSF